MCEELIAPAESVLHQSSTSVSRDSSASAVNKCSSKRRDLFLILKDVY